MIKLTAQTSGIRRTRKVALLNNKKREYKAGIKRINAKRPTKAQKRAQKRHP